MRDHHDAGLTVFILYGWLVVITGVVALPIAALIAWRRREQRTG